MRTHSLFQSSDFLEFVATSTPIQNDVSLFLPFSKDLPTTTLHFSGASLFRIPYSWEDDEAMSRPNWNWSAQTWPGKLRQHVVWDFHPIHVVLNSNRHYEYLALKEFLKDRPLHDLKESEAKAFVNDGIGTRTYLRELLRNRDWSWMKIRDLSETKRT